MSGQPTPILSALQIEIRHHHHHRYHHLKSVVVIEPVFSMSPLDCRVVARFAADLKQLLKEISSVLHHVARTVAYCLPGENPDQILKSFRCSYLGVGKWYRHHGKEKKNWVFVRLSLSCSTERSRSTNGEDSKSDRFFQDGTSVFCVRRSVGCL